MAKTSDAYEVRLNGRVVAHTANINLRLSPQRERELQQAGYEIYIEGRKLQKIIGRKDK